MIKHLRSSLDTKLEGVDIDGSQWRGCDSRKQVGIVYIDGLIGKMVRFADQGIN